MEWIKIQDAQGKLEQEKQYHVLVDGLNVPLFALWDYSLGWEFLTFPSNKEPYMYPASVKKITHFCLYNPEIF